MKEWLLMTMLQSKKVWYTIAAIVIPLIAKSLDVDETSVSNIFWALVSLTGAQGIADMGEHAK